MRKRANYFILLLFLSVGLGIISTGGFLCERVLALSYQSQVGINFTFNPTLSVSLSDADLIISNLTPGTYSDSNIITIFVETNAAYGYYLTATAGTSSTNTNLTHTSNGNYVFTSLATTAGVASTLSDIAENYWGYSYSADNGASWVSGNIDSAISGYAGLPLDNDDNGETGVALLREDSAGSRSVQFKIGARASVSQAAGEYTNVVNFYAVTNPKPDFLYDVVAEMSKGKQTAADLQATITTPTSTNPAEDTSNSGVYEYDPSVFGTSSDASNDYKIYYYRGILETDPGTYGSAGSANAYPNYVKLSNNTCWRIVRTTGSGGVKMIYNGIWTGSTCANSTTSAQVTTQAFAAKGASAQSTYWYRNIHYVGYTYNNAVTDSTTSTSVDTVFGNNSDLSLNNTRSNIKTYLEDTWYANNMTSYMSILEANAGYCNDRFAYTGYGTAVLTTIVPYTSSGNASFGAYTRNFLSINLPSLTCSRNTVDLYRYVVNSTGVSNELKYPAALLTADEASFAGSGNGSSNMPAYSPQSYLCSGTGFWLFSPSDRSSGGYASEFVVKDTGSLNINSINNTPGVRPVISLVPGTIITGGTGAATDPWTVE